jgi:diguanylate cyclase (GGDEF)-like protein/PAS domain S-box-containing protein
MKVATTAVSHPDPPGAGDSGGSQERALVLVVDDDDQLRMLTVVCLEEAGFDVVEAEDATSALACFQEHAPDLVLCDVMMPGMDAFELCGALRAVPNGAHVPIVMMMGLEDMDSIERAYAAGATEFCIKPVNWTLLPRHILFILKVSKTQEQLRISEERYAMAARGASDGLWDWDLRRDTVFYSPRWLELLGIDASELTGQPDDWLDRVHPEDCARVRAELDSHLEGRHLRFESEHRIRTGGEGYLWVLVRGIAVRDSSGKPVRMAGSLTDISERTEALQRLEHNALHDALTDLPNRTLFMDRLSHCMQRALRHPDERFAVMFIDLDRFKVINDSLGHLVGDRLLVEVGQRLKQLLRSGETLARLGGDEFAVLIEEFGDDGGPQRVAERIHESLRNPAIIDGHSVVTMASIGITVKHSNYELAEEMLRDADVAMYAAKSKGSGHTEFFSPAMRVRAVRCLEMERELRSAIEQEQIIVNYQPIVALGSGRISGFEALVRWEHPEQGLLLPESFLDVAVDTGLIVPIGRMVMEQACTQLMSWQAQWHHGSEWCMAVNLCAQELMQADLLSFIENMLQRTGADPTRLKLEVTERSLIGNLEQARAVMLKLRERGIRMSVDDFGTGFSSFSYLQRLPFDVLKIDRSFITDLENDGDKSQIIQAMIRVAHELGLEVVAEGSEQHSSIECLKSLRCEYVQGNLLAPAMSVEALRPFLAAERCPESMRLVV